MCEGRTTARRVTLQSGLGIFFLFIRCVSSQTRTMIEHTTTVDPTWPKFQAPDPLGWLGGSHWREGCASVVRWSGKAARFAHIIACTAAVH